MSAVTQVDTKGKIFTTRVTKRPLRVLVQTHAQTFVGTVHVTLENRLLDDLNAPASQFLALTDVQVYSQGTDTLLYITSFLALNKAHIISIAPVENLSKDKERSLGVWLTSLRAILREDDMRVEGTP